MKSVCVAALNLTQIQLTCPSDDVLCSRNKDLPAVQQTIQVENVPCTFRKTTAMTIGSKGAH